MGMSTEVVNGRKYQDTIAELVSTNDAMLIPHLGYRIRVWTVAREYPKADVVFNESDNGKLILEYFTGRESLFAEFEL